MRNKIRNLLISLANKIGTKDYYDFGEPIVSMREYCSYLVVSTKSGVFVWDGDLIGGYKRIKNLSK